MTRNWQNIKRQQIRSIIGEKIKKLRKLAAEVRLKPDNKHRQYQIKGAGLVTFHFL